LKRLLGHSAKAAPIQKPRELIALGARGQLLLELAAVGDVDHHAAPGERSAGEIAHEVAAVLHPSHASIFRNYTILILDGPARGERGFRLGNDSISIVGMQRAKPRV